MALLDDAKITLRITTNAFDGEISDLINSAKDDLNLTGVVIGDNPPPLVKRAILSYVKLNFGECENWERLKKSYDEQKAQLMMSTAYNGEGVANG